MRDSKELLRHASVNTMEVGGAGIIPRSDSGGSDKSTTATSRFRPKKAYTPMAPIISSPPVFKGLNGAAGTSKGNVGRVLSLIHILVTCTLAIACFILYHDIRAKQDMLATCEMDHVILRDELDRASVELGKMKLNAVQKQQPVSTTTLSATPTLKCPPCPEIDKDPVIVNQPCLDSVHLAALKSLVQERDELEKKLKFSHLGNNPKLIRAIDSMKDVNFKLTTALQSVSREFITAKYGFGPYFVDFVVALPSDDNLYTLSIELNVDETPYTVLYFMLQISAGVWKGCYFNINAGHVLVASPSPLGERSQTAHKSYPNSNRCDREQFNRVIGSGSINAHLPFQEYSYNRQHKPFTVGIPGR